MTTLWELLKQHHEYSPPWRRREYTPKLGWHWVSYGPSSDGKWQAERIMFSRSTAGGGLWDQDKVQPRTVPPRKWYDEVYDYVMNSGRASPEDYNVFVAYFDEQMSLSKTAAAIGESIGTTNMRISRLKRRARRWLRRC